MPKVLQQAYCSAKFPDDTVWDDDGEVIVQTAGLAMATAVAELLRARGMEVSDPEDHLEHGWELDVQWQGGVFWMQVTWLDEDEAIVMTRDHSLGLLARLIGKTSPYRAFLEILHEALVTDHRFDDVRWFPDGGGAIGVEGALSPSSEYPGPARA